MGDSGDVECEPGARHDDDARRIVAGGGVAPDFAPIEFAVASARSHVHRNATSCGLRNDPECDTGMSRRAGREGLIECPAAIGAGA